MSAEVDKIKAEIAFYNEIGPLYEELEAAREVKADDPVRFSEAKQAFEVHRTYWRQIGEFLHAEAKQDNEAAVNIIVGEGSVRAEAIAPFGGEG